MFRMILLAENLFFVREAVMYSCHPCVREGGFCEAKAGRVVDYAHLIRQPDGCHLLLKEKAFGLRLPLDGEAVCKAD
jgi:hypothetical protein